MKWILFAVTIPWTITVSWGWVLIMMMIYAARAPRLEEYGTLTAVWRPWAAKIWKYSTTLGRGIIFQPGTRREYKNDPYTPTEFHEFIHVRQVEDNMLTAFILGGIISIVSGIWWVFIAIWWSGGMWQITNFITSGLRNGWSLNGVYRHSEHEKSAYSQTKEYKYN